MIDKVALFIIEKKLVTRTQAGIIKIGNKKLDEVSLNSLFLQNTALIKLAFGEPGLYVNKLELVAEIEAYFKSLDELDNDADQAYEVAKEHFPFLWLAKQNGQQLYYMLVSKVTKEVVPVTNVSLPGLLIAIRSDVTVLAALEKVWRENFPRASFQQFIQRVQTSWEMDPERGMTEEPTLISWDKEQVTFKYFDPSNLVAQPTPSWDEFTSRLDHPEIFKAWVWSVFEQRDYGRQAMWIKGEGFDGKSTVARALQRIYGDTGVTSISQKAYESNFFYNTVYGKRFAIYGDAKSPNVVLSEKIHSLLGGDIVSIEAKGENPFMGRVFCKLLILSNIEPHIDTDRRNEVSRILFLKVQTNPQAKGSIDFEDNLVAERDGFLYSCREAYRELLADGTEMDMPDVMKESLEEAHGGSVSDVIQLFLGERVELDNEESVSSAVLYKEFRAFARDYGVGASEVTFNEHTLRSALKEKGAVFTKTANGRYFKGVRLSSNTPTGLI